TIQPDPGQTPTDLGQFTVSRSGFGLDAVTVHVAAGGPGTGVAIPGIDHIDNLPTTVLLSPGSTSKIIYGPPVANTNRQVPVIAQLTLLPGTNYSLGAENSANVVIYHSATANGTGLQASYYTNSSTTYTSTNNFNTNNLILSRTDPVIDFSWTNGASPNLSTGLYTVRWTGQIEPQYSETYYFDTLTDDGV